MLKSNAYVCAEKLPPSLTLPFSRNIPTLILCLEAAIVPAGHRAERIFTEPDVPSLRNMVWTVSTVAAKAKWERQPIDALPRRRGFSRGRRL